MMLAAATLDSRYGDSRRDHYDGTDLNKSIKLSIRKKNKLNYVEYATFVAKKSPMVQKHGCVIVHKGKIVATGFNRPLQPFGYSVHAEADAVMKAKKLMSVADLKHCSLYVVRIGTDAMNYPLKYSKPCVSCSNMIAKAKIDKVFYSISCEESLCMIC